VHANDIVPQLPPQGDVGKLFDFHHPPTEVWYRPGEHYKVAARPPTQPLFPSKCNTRPLSLPPPPSLPLSFSLSVRV
jgi:hypothetical protein